MVLFCPSLPAPPIPHAHKVPSVFIAAVKLAEQLTVDQLVKAPIWTGDERKTVSLVPSCPYVLLPHTYNALFLIATV